jgi:hypothetical protein
MEGCKLIIKEGQTSPVFKKLHPLIDNPVSHSPTWRKYIITEMNICTRIAPAEMVSVPSLLAAVR